VPGPSQDMFPIGICCSRVCVQWCEVIITFVDIDVIADYHCSNVLSKQYKHTYLHGYQPVTLWQPDLLKEDKAQKVLAKWLVNHMVMSRWLITLSFDAGTGAYHISDISIVARSQWAEPPIRYIERTRMTASYYQEGMVGPIKLA